MAGLGMTKGEVEDCVFGRLSADPADIPRLEAVLNLPYRVYVVAVEKLCSGEADLSDFGGILLSVERSVSALADAEDEDPAEALRGNSGVEKAPGADPVGALVGAAAARLASPGGLRPPPLPEESAKASVSAAVAVRASEVSGSPVDPSGLVPSGRRVSTPARVDRSTVAALTAREAELLRKLASDPSDAATLLELERVCERLDEMEEEI